MYMLDQAVSHPTSQPSDYYRLDLIELSALICVRRFVEEGPREPGEGELHRPVRREIRTCKNDALSKDSTIYTSKTSVSVSRHTVS